MQTVIHLVIEKHSIIGLNYDEQTEQSTIARA